MAAKKRKKQAESKQDNSASRMGMMAWFATEGGTKCPMCGRYAKAEELGNLSFNTTGTVIAHESAAGHLPGFGCNKKKL